MRLWWKRRPVTIDTTLGSLVALAPTLVFVGMVFATIKREATMQITEKDIFCVLEGRAQKRLLKLLIPGLPVAIAATITMAVLLPDTWQAMLIMIAVVVVILARPVHRWWKAMDALKEEAKKLHQELYQAYISGHLDLRISQPDQP